MTYPKFGFVLIHPPRNFSLQWVSQSIKNITEDNQNQPLSYITHKDICSSFEGDTLLAVQAPTGTHLEVPIPSVVPDSLKKQYQIHLRSHEGPIYVILVNKDASSSSPVAVEVPPSAEIQAVLADDPVTADRENQAPPSSAVVSSRCSRRIVGQKAKAGSPPVEDDAKPAKIAKLNKSEKKKSNENLDEHEDDERAAKEVEKILGTGNVDAEMSMFEEFMHSESKPKSILTTMCIAYLNGLFSLYL